MLDWACCEFTMWQTYANRLREAEKNRLAKQARTGNPATFSPSGMGEGPVGALFVLAGNCARDSLVPCGGESCQGVELGWRPDYVTDGVRADGEPAHHQDP